MRKFACSMAFSKDGRVVVSIPVTLAGRLGRLKLVKFSSDEKKARVELTRGYDGSKGATYGNRHNYAFPRTALAGRTHTFPAMAATLSCEGEILILDINKEAPVGHLRDLIEEALAA